MTHGGASAASPPLTDHLVQRWVPSGPRPFQCHVPRAGTHLRTLGSPRPFSAPTFSDLAYSRAMAHSRGRAQHGTVLASFPDRLVVTQDTEDWAQAPIYILPFMVPRLAAEYSVVPMNMELLGISAGLELFIPTVRNRWLKIKTRNSNDLIN